MLTQQEKQGFHENGVLRLRSFLPPDLATQAQTSTFAHLEKAGIRRDGNWMLTDILSTNLPQTERNLIHSLKNCREIAGLIGDEVAQVMRELLDGQESFSLGSPQVLFTLPNADAWDLPHKLWHIDIPLLPDSRIPGVQIFTFLDRVVPGGGGTLVVAGSHRMIDVQKRLGSQQAKQLLKQYPYFRDLMSPDGEDRSHFLQKPVQIGDVCLQVIELHGEPGDIYLTDLRLLHTIAPNASTSPRIMLTERFLLESSRKDILGIHN